MPILPNLLSKQKRRRPKGKQNLAAYSHLVSHYSAIGDTISRDAPYRAIGFRGKLLLRYPLSKACLWTTIGHFFGKKWGCSSDSLRYHRKHSATGVLLHLSCDWGGNCGRVTKFAIPIALYRPQIGPPARNGKKMAKKWIWAPPKKKGKKWPKNGKIGPKIAQKWPFSHFWAIFSPFSRWGQNPFFGHFFPISGRRPDLGPVQGNRDRNTKYGQRWSKKGRSTLIGRTSVHRSSGVFMRTSPDVGLAPDNAWRGLTLHPPSTPPPNQPGPLAMGGRDGRRAGAWGKSPPAAMQLGPDSPSGGSRTDWQFRKKVVLANVPSFWFLVPGEHPKVPSFRFLVPGEHPPKPPFWKPPFYKPPKNTDTPLLSETPQKGKGKKKKRHACKTRREVPAFPQILFPETPKKEEIHAWKTRLAWILLITFLCRSYALAMFEVWQCRRQRLTFLLKSRFSLSSSRSLSASRIRPLSSRSRRTTDYLLASECRQGVVS